jgi:phage shock protein A
MFAFLFGKKEKQVAGAIVNPTADLQAREEHLEKKIRQLEKIKESHHINAVQQKALGKTNSALHFLKKEKLIEDEIATTNGMLLTIIQQRSALEQAYMNKESLQVLNVANKSIKESQTVWSADKVSDLVDEMEDTRNVTREINDLISGANRFYVSDEELLASLESEEKENNLVSQISQINSGIPERAKSQTNSGIQVLTPDLPLPPSGSLTQIKNNNITMLQELEAL